MPVLDGEQGDHRAEDPVDLVGGGEQCPGPVLAGQAQLQRVLAGGEAVPLPVGLLGPITDLGQALLDLVEGGGGLLVLGVETFLPGVEPGDLRLQGREGQLRLLGTGEGFFARLAQPLDLLVGAGRARLQRVDLTVQAGQALAAVGRGPLEAGDAALLLGRRVLGRLAGGDRGVEGGAVGVHLGGDLLLLLGDPVGLGLQRLGVATAGGLDDVAPGGVADALGGQRLGAAQALAQAGEGVPGVLGRRQRRQVLAQRRLQRGLALPGRGDGRLDLLAAGEEDRLVGHLLLQRGAGGDQVVGQQAGPGVAHVGLDRRGAPGHLGLPAQRLELAADLGEQVVETRQVALARVELAQRLLLALAVLEDARGLLDEAAAVLRRGVQDRVELALAHDDVHLAADAGVAEQLLDVQQPARLGVDGVLRAAGAEHRATDRHLGVLDGQRAIGVVDGEQDLGPAQGRASGGAGEDDVVHLAAAQALGAGLAHHPRQGVDDVGLARPVGTDDAGDARLELQRRGGREGLEPLEGQALQVQRGTFPVDWLGGWLARARGPQEPLGALTLLPRTPRPGAARRRGRCGRAGPTAAPGRPPTRRRRTRRVR